LNNTWFNSLPLFDEDKSLVLVFNLIKSEAVPAKNSIYTVQSFLQQQVRLLLIQSIKHDKQSVVYTKQSIVSISSSRKTLLILPVDLAQERCLVMIFPHHVLFKSIP